MAAIDSCDCEARLDMIHLSNETRASAVIGWCTAKTKLGRRVYKGETCGEYILCLVYVLQLRQYWRLLEHKY